MKHKLPYVLLGTLLILGSCADKDTQNSVAIPQLSDIQKETMPESLHDFSFASFAAMLDLNENLLYAPLPAYRALALFMCDANVETKEELQRVLHYNGDENALIQQLKSADSQMEQQDVLHSAASLWYRPFLHLSQPLLNSAKQLDIELKQTDFQKNDIQRLTKQWLDHALDQSDIPVLPINQDTSMIYLTTLSFHDDWQLPFSKEETLPQDFHINETNTVTVDMMHQNLTPISYRDHTSYEAIALPFQNGSNMNLYLPKVDHTVQDILKDDPKWMDPITSSQRMVELSLPAFSYHQLYSMKEPFMKLGMKRAFTNELAQFSSMDDGQPLYIDDILQGTAIDVSEAGASASAYAAVLFSTGCGESLEQVTMTFDHPFLFVITSPQDIPLFMGYVQHPTA